MGNLSIYSCHLSSQNTQTKNAGLSYSAAMEVTAEQQESTVRSGVNIYSCLKDGVSTKSLSDINKGSLYIF